MADETPKPMTDQDISPAAADAFAPADPLKSAGDDFASPSSGSDTNASGADTATSGDEGSPGARQTISENVTKLKGEAADRVLGLADQGKARASGALDQLSQMLNDAAAQVDDKLGAQYGQYARNAAESVQGFSSSLNDRSVDDLLDDARALVRKSPAVAIGAAAAAGFVVARLLSAGLDQRDKG
ncbi:hypothetical protein [Sphingomonas sp. NBWT7]|uniref:hypothetical protein n=1 Tax=Sphingomonas sp. NBWT7 TaxID=2596913 RepID=UPI0021564CD9|nr:hypothetical protein [Sphingomonas sp. NBWT7]